MITSLCLFKWKDDFDLYERITCKTTFDNNISEYCVFIEREEDILINSLCLSNGKITINNSLIEAELKDLTDTGIIKFIDWVNNEACVKMMLCDYSRDSIEEYLKSLL